MIRLVADLGALSVGLALLAVGGEALVRAAVSIGWRLGVSPLIAGLVFVSFGTSLPELVVSVDAALHQQEGVALGNALGSNIGNILLILGVCALITPLSVARHALTRDASAMLGAAVLFVVLGWDGGLGKLDGVILLGCLLAYLIWAYRMEVRRNLPSAAVQFAEAQEMPLVPRSLWLTLLFFGGGLAALMAGSSLTLHGALKLGQLMSLPDVAIGLTVVALGTSLPEFAVSVLASVRGRHDVAVGNVLGSNLFNILGVLGSAAMLQPLPMAGRMLWFDQWVMLAASLMLTVVLATGRRIDRLEGVLMLAMYLAYLGISFTVFGSSE